MDAKMVQCKSAVSPSRLPGLDWAINPYRGCEHGCAYCYVQDVTRYSADAAWGGYVEAKVNIAQQLKKDLRKGVSGVYGIGTVTDPYQPAEGRFELTRGCLALLKRYDASISILTKSDLVLRDLDLLSSWPGAEVGISLACVDPAIASLLEPGAPSPERRVDALRRLVDSGVDTYVMAAPFVPGLSDHEDSLLRLVDSVASAGVKRIMWDIYNPRPIADSRMSSRVPGLDISLLKANRGSSSSIIRAKLGEACQTRGITLLDAF